MLCKSLYIRNIYRHILIIKNNLTRKVITRKVQFCRILGAEREVTAEKGKQLTPSLLQRHHRTARACLYFLRLGVTGRWSYLPLYPVSSLAWWLLQGPKNRAREASAAQTVLVLTFSCLRAWVCFVIMFLFVLGACWLGGTCGTLTHVKGVAYWCGCRSSDARVSVSASVRLFLFVCVCGWKGKFSHPDHRRRRRRCRVVLNSSL